MRYQNTALLDTAHSPNRPPPVDVPGGGLFVFQPVTRVVDREEHRSQTV